MTVSGEGPLAPHRVAAAAAPAVDRLRLAIAGRARERLAPVLTQWDVGPRALQTVAMLRNTVPDRAVHRDHLGALFVYQPDGPAMVDEVIAQGLVHESPTGALRLTEAGRRIVGSIHRVTGDIAGELWSGREEHCATLAGLAGRVADAAARSGGGALSVLAPLAELPGATPALVLAERLTLLRFHRFDAHVAAWRAAGLTAGEVAGLPPGPVRDTVEEETNRRAGEPYEVLDPDERFAFCAGLGALPG
ncbi:MAG TPA: hypothetical protein VFJ85_05365 [Acidimicrobiales bacterium]|nr:hypothetical protein [Acidimicrobiales bacterium]